MAQAYDLTRLDESSFEHLANFLALRVLGAGHTGFGPGPDGGRDGYFQGEAPYPSKVERWTGNWYVQSKFHAPKYRSPQVDIQAENLTRRIGVIESEPSPPGGCDGHEQD